MATWLLAAAASLLVIGIFFWPDENRSRKQRPRRCPKCGEATLGADDVCWFCDWRGRSRRESEQRQAQQVAADITTPRPTIRPSEPR
ncbi:MAG: hypothetical protein ACREF3_06330 [Acetobacteraceae bacterium]